LHLKIAGRLHWRNAAPKAPPKNLLAAVELDNGTQKLTQPRTQHRASLHVVAGEEGLRMLDAGGLEVLETGLEEFARVLQSSNHTLKRALTDPHLFSGIGNAYSDEILHRARLSPVAMTQKLKPDEIAKLHAAIRETLTEWVDRLRAETGEAFPEKVTAFRPAMAVHGRYGQPCPRCGAKVQRIRYASNETNYCAPCQTGGRLMADRGLSRLLKQDWPRSLEELDELKKR
jgi:formamidopyrimidine-DNA glycosylase